MTGDDPSFGPSSSEALVRAPMRNPNLALVRRPDGAMLVDVAGTARLRLNETAAAVWELCDGTTTVREIVEAMNQLWAASPSVVVSEVLAVVETFIDNRSLLPSVPARRAGGEREAEP